MFDLFYIEDVIALVKKAKAAEATVNRVLLVMAKQLS